MKEMREIRLTTPLTEPSVRDLRIGDIVYLSGHLFTARTSFHVRVLERGLRPPVDFKSYNVMAHCGPVMRKDPDGRWTAVHAGGTTSNRFEKFGSGIIRELDLRALIGKGTMGRETLAAMKEFGCVHLTTNLDRMGFTPYLEEVVGVHNLDELGVTEATWLFKVKDCGPFVVDMDSMGNHLFMDIHLENRKRIGSIQQGSKDR